MKLIIQWTEGRQTRQTETDIPQGKNWTEVQKYLTEALRKAYKYCDEPLPEGLTESELHVKQ